MKKRQLAFIGDLFRVTGRLSEYRLGIGWYKNIQSEESLKLSRNDGEDECDLQNQ